MSNIIKGYELAVRHLKERAEWGQNIVEIIEEMEQVIQNNK